MCFSVEADLVAGAALVPVGVLSLREVRKPDELPFAALPLLFALHQFVEAVVWAGFDGDVSAGLAHAAAVVYLVYALVALPTLVPLALLLLEDRRARKRIAPFVVLGVVVSVALARGLLARPVGVVPHAHAVEYQTGVTYGLLWAVLYVIAVVGPTVLSGYRSIVAFGVLNLVGLVVAAVLYQSVFASLWCVYAALVSVLVLVHMILRRRLRDPDRVGETAWPAARG